MLTEGTTAPAAPPADVCLLVEGTYPFVAGGVSAWVHDIIAGRPELTFAVLNIGPHPGAYSQPRYSLPPNVTRLHQVYCQERLAAPLTSRERRALDGRIRERRGREEPGPSAGRVLAALRRFHFEDALDDQVLVDLMSDDLTVPDLLHGRRAFDLFAEIGTRLAPGASFLDLFWHLRAIHVPLLRLLSTPLVHARCYHAVSTGYAGLVGAAFSLRTGRPLVVTEHGIYSRERDMDLARASWIKDRPDDADDAGDAPSPSPLRLIWSRSFRAMARLAYHRASRIVTLSAINRRRQIADGAAAPRISIVPNGVDVSPQTPAPDPAESGPAGPLRVGFVGRVVPIKDVVTFIKACHLALHTTPLAVSIIGPDGEDAPYASRCRELVTTLGRGSSIRFVGPLPAERIYRDLDVVALTSFSEGQPLVMLEAYAAGLPAIATDVGACREMIEGREPDDRQLGPSGFVTRVASPVETATALVHLARNPALRRRMGAAGRARVTRFYQRQDMLDSYRTLYRDMIATDTERIDAGRAA